VERERNVRVHGNEIVDALTVFYDSVDRLFRAGAIGGLRVIATKP
jgi:hypothetical protein